MTSRHTLWRLTALIELDYTRAVEAQEWAFQPAGMLFDKSSRSRLCVIRWALRDGPAKHKDLRAALAVRSQRLVEALKTLRNEGKIEHTPIGWRLCAIRTPPIQPTLPFDGAQAPLNA